MNDLIMCWSIIWISWCRLLSFSYILIVECELTPNGRLVDRIPYSYGWVDGVQE